MRKNIIIILFSMLIPLSSYGATEADADERIEKLYGEYVPYKEFFFKFRNNVKNGNIVSLSKMVKYPLLVTEKGNKTIINNESEFTSQYETIFTKDIKEIVLNKQYSEWGGNWRGLIYGNGNLWVTGICKPASKNKCLGLEVKLVTINK